MLVKIDGIKDFIETDNLKKIGEGLDGVLFLYNNNVIKINNSDYMTHEKFDDIISAKKNACDNGLNIEKASIVFPDRKVNLANSKVKKLKITPLFGYTQKYIVEKKGGIENLTTCAFIDGIKKISDEVHSVFSNNNIAITDTNPNNLLVSENNKIYLIDLDRNITKSCTLQEREMIRNSDYFSYNELRLAKTINRALIYQVYKDALKDLKKRRLIIEMMQEEELKSCSLNQTFIFLSNYDTIKEYADDRAKKLYIKK